MLVILFFFLFYVTLKWHCTTVIYKLTNLKVTKKSEIWMDFETLERWWPNYRMLLTSNRPKTPNRWITLADPSVYHQPTYTSACYFCKIIRGLLYTDHVKCGVCMFPARMNSAFPDWWTSALISGNYSAPVWIIQPVHTLKLFINTYTTPTSEHSVYLC